ncbi:MAG: hypothetical protein ABSF35_12580 [Polyangia bacterium]|jgi:hypothetical protein
MGNTTTPRRAVASRAVRWTALALRVGLIGAILAASVTPALGQDDEKAVKKIVDLNKKALAAIDAKKFDVARDGLLQAESVAKQANLLTHKMLARTYVHLGAVYFLGYNDRKNAVRCFGLAKNIRPDIPMTPSLATPTLTALFDKATAGAGESDPWGEAAASGPHPLPSVSPPSGPVKPSPTPPPPTPPPPPASPPVALGEPDLPAVLPSGLYCPAVEEAPEGHEIIIRCAAKPALKVESILLYYRASGAPTYAVAAMQNSPKGWLEASIPAEAATGESMQYYCEARNSADDVVATSGQQDIPNPIILTPAAPDSSSTNPRVATGGKGDGEDPLKGIKREQDTEVLERGIHRRRQGAFWLGGGWGTGVGYHLASLLEWRRDAPPVSAGWHQAGWYNSYWEVGYLITDHIGTAVQARWEYIPIQGSGDANPGRPANGAISVIGRGLYYLDLGTGNAQIQFSADFGGGDGYRFAFPPTNPNHTRILGTTADGNCIKDGSGNCILAPTLLTDTVRSGPIVYGASAGFIYHFTRHIAANFELRFLGAGPHLGLLLEGYASLQLAFGGKMPVQAGDAPPMERLPEEDEEP